MIKNVVFDIGNVIWKKQPSIVLEKFPFTEEEKEEINNTFFSDTKSLDLGKETLEEHFYKCPRSITSNERVKEILINNYKYREFNINIVELINKLKKDNYNVYILSNINKEAIDYLMQAPELKCIDGWVVSCYHGVMKPDLKIYEILFNEFNIKPEESFFIDDLEENVRAGASFGMEGYILTNVEEGIDGLLNYMKLYGINV